MKTKQALLLGKIEKIKNKLAGIGIMRPGTLTRQYKDPKSKSGPYFQISYTHNMRSRTAYVRSEDVKATKQQIVTYKKFKNLVKKWIDLSIEYSQIK